MWVERNGKTYRIRDLAGGEKITVKSGFANKTAAKDHMIGLKADKLRGKALVHRGGEVQLDDWIDLWWPSYEISLKASARVSSFGVLHRYIRPMLGGHELDDITPLVVQRWVADLRAGRTRVKAPKPLSRKTAANAHGLLHKILSEAVTAKLIAENPCAKTRLGQKQHHEMQFLTTQEAERLVNAMPEHWRLMVLLMLGTGLRWGETIALRVKDVDVLGRKLHVRKNLQELRDHAGFVEEDPKTAAGRRTVTFTKDLALELTALVIDKGSDARVFLAPKGGQVRYRPFWAQWDRARKEAGLPKLRIHDMRHTHAAWLISSNIRGGLTAVQRRLGHSSIRVTSDMYGHLMHEVDDDIMAVLDERMPQMARGESGEPEGQQRPETTGKDQEMPAISGSRTIV